jgi:ribokinase
MRAVVVGSLHMDLIVGVPELPSPGQTLLSRSRARSPGGKGANQAVAAARLGRRVSIVGRVGADAAGRGLRDGLRAEGVDVEHLREDPDAPSGIALIAVAPDGENTIIVSPGANGRVGPEDVQAASGLLGEAAVTLLQLEIPEDAVRAAAHAAGGTLVLNPAPARELDGDVLQRVDVLVPNRGELELLAGPGDPADAARRLAGPRAVVVTLGADGALVVDGDHVEHVRAHPVEVVDTTGAGDAFCGALADALARGALLTEAARWGVAAAALSVTRRGAQEGMPTAEATRQL